MYYSDIEIKRQQVDSPNVASLGYHDEYNILAIEMLDNRVYYYLDIPKEHFIKMVNPNGDGKQCASIGSYMSRNIKGNYRYVRI